MCTLKWRRRMKLKNKKSGFTLLEIIIVIIIVGVLASLALPRLFATVEYSRSTEATNSFTAVRGSMERCYLKNGNYARCVNFADLDAMDPGASPGAHFSYGITSYDAANQSYTITATRSGTGDTITVTQDNGTSSVAVVGTGAFSAL
jgi:prepilin-type N-terminal cleavage/methylation domain-containing protein